MVMRPSKFIFYLEWLRTMDDAVLSKAERNRLIDAIITYADTGIIPELPRLLMAIFSPIKATLDRDAEKYHSKVETNRENGKKGGRPKTQQNPEKPNGFHENPEKPNNINIDNNIHKDIHISNAAEPTEEEKEIIYLIFYWRNFIDPAAELNKYLEYNGQRKWKALNTPTKRLMSASNDWQPQDKTPRVRQQFLDMWYSLYGRIKNEDPNMAADMIDTRAKFEFQGSEAKLRCRSKALREYIERERPPEILQYIGDLKLTTAAP